MSDTIKIRNKATGEIITLRRKQTESTSVQPKESYISGVNKRTGLSEREVAGRGSLFNNIQQNLSAQSPVRKIIGGLEAIGAPLQMVESGLSNPALALQKGVKDPRVLLNEAMLGFTGKKQGEIGDILYRGGVPKPIASGAGLAVTIGAPLRIAKYTGKFFNGISKMTDKGILKAGATLIKATEEARAFTGTKVAEAFKPFNYVVVDSKKLLNVFRKLPKPVSQGIEENVGYIKDILKNPTIDTLRKVKHFIGEMRPTAFGKEARGAAETLEGKYINEVYRGIKQIMHETLKTRFGDETAQALMSAEKAYSSVSKASNLVKKTIVEPTLGLPTRAGEAARKLVVEGDVSFRSALNSLRQSGKTAKRDIDRAVSSLERFNRWVALKKAAEMTGKAVAFGGAAGALGGAVTGKIINKNND